MEIIALFLKALVIGIIATFIFELILKTNRRLRDRYYRRHEILLGYHVHHSTIGLLLVVMAVVLFLTDYPLFALNFAGVGAGIIVMHTISSKRFVFIEKENF